MKQLSRQTRLIKTWLSLGLGGSLMAYAPLALAHAGHTHGFNSLLEGLMHPLTGLDHLFLALGFGVLTAKLFIKTRLAILSGAGFITALITGFWFGHTLQPANVWIETSISASLVVLAAALWLLPKLLTQRQQYSLQIGLSAVAPLLLTTTHGMAHALELPHVLNPLDFMAGMVLSMTCLLGLGYSLTKVITSSMMPRIIALILVATAVLN